MILVENTRSYSGVELCIPMTNENTKKVSLISECDGCKLVSMV